MWTQLRGTSPIPIPLFLFPQLHNFVHLSYSGSRQFIIARVYDFLWYFMQHFQNSADMYDDHVFACQQFFFFILKGFYQI